MPLSVCHDFPRAVSFELRLVSDLKDTPLTTRLAGGRQIRESSAKATDHHIFERSSGIVDLPYAGLSTKKLSSLDSCCLSCTLSRAIASVCTRWGDLKMRSARKAIAPSLGDVRLLSASSATSLALASK